MSARAAPAATFDATDARLMRRLHGGFPLTETPYADVGAELGLAEAEVIGRLQRLLRDGVLTRFGPLFQIERAGGCFVLAAMQVPPDRFEAVAAAVNALPEVAHNYRREHRFNLWFVLGADTPQAVQAACARIESGTGLRVFAFPKEREFFLELALPIEAPPC